MDYKKIFRTRNIRTKVLRMLRFVPDKPMIKLQYRMKTGRKLDLKNPKRYTEKLQWYKLYYKNPEMIRCVDKYDVREFVKEHGLEEILIENYGVYDRAEDIRWDDLPNSFVMKDTLGGGGNSVRIISDKNGEDLNELKALAKKWTERRVRKHVGGREWPYSAGKKHRVIFERNISNPEEKNSSIADYKFFCFNGRFCYGYILTNRKMGESVELAVIDSEYRMLPVIRDDEKVPGSLLQKPQNFDKMVNIAEILSKDFPHARIDLYNISGRIYFGEITFFDGSGYMKFDPDAFDFEMGNCFELPERA